jgi:hypothetical protein
VVESRRLVRLKAEAADALGGGQLAGADHLEGNEAVQALLTGLEDDAHAALGNLFQKLVRAGSRNFRTTGISSGRAWPSVSDVPGAESCPHNDLRATGTLHLGHLSVISSSWVYGSSQLGHQSTAIVGLRRVAVASIKREGSLPAPIAFPRTGS